MRRAVIALTVTASVLVPLTRTPVRTHVPFAQRPTQVAPQRVSVPVEIVQAPPAKPTDEIILARELFKLTNEARARHDTAPLRWWKAAALPAAKAQTMRMLDAGKIFHNPGLEQLLYTLHARTIGENVGMGPTIVALQRAFMKSKGHRQNILDPIFTHAAVWVTKDVDGVLFVTVVFARF